MRAVLAAILPLLLLPVGLGVGCGEGGGKLPEACLDTTLPVLELPQGAGSGDAPGREAAVIVEQRTDRIAGGTAGTVKILAFDFATYQGQAAPVDFDGENCWRIVGQPVIDTPPEPLTVHNARVEKLATGVVDAGPSPAPSPRAPSPSCWVGKTRG